MLFKLYLYAFTDFDQLNTYLLNKYNILACQHRVSIFSFQILNRSGLKTFDHFSKSFSNCFKLDIF